MLKREKIGVRLAEAGEGGRWGEDGGRTEGRKEGGKESGGGVAGEGGEERKSTKGSRKWRETEGQRERMKGGGTEGGGEAPSAVGCGEESWTERRGVATDQPCPATPDP